MTRWIKVAGDEGDTLTVTLNGVANLATAETVEAHVWRGAESATLAAAVTDSAARQVTVQLGTWLGDGPAAGEWRLEVQVGFAGGVELTWPALRPDVISIRAQAPAGTP